MTRYTIPAALVAIFAFVVPVQGYQGPAPLGTAIADYDPATGQLSVSVNNVINWYIQSASFSLTGDAALGLPADGGLLSDNDEIIGEVTGFSYMNYTDLNLGNAAATGLSLGDLTINWQPDLGIPIQTAPVSYDFLPLVPEPTTAALALGAILFCAIGRRRVR